MTGWRNLFDSYTGRFVATLVPRGLDARGEANQVESLVGGKQKAELLAPFQIFLFSFKFRPKDSKKKSFPIENTQIC